jgi:hypothetical protein
MAPCRVRNARRDTAAYLERGEWAESMAFRFHGGSGGNRRRPFFKVVQQSRAYAAPLLFNG